MRQRTSRGAAIAVLSLCVWGCRADVPDAIYVCDTTDDCPPGQACAAGLCQRDPSMTCVPRTCADRNAECGEIDDGCGGTLACGTCEAPEECGVGDLPNVCDCVPTTCGDAQCGFVPNGCGASVECGACDAPATCGGGGVDNACGCGAVDCTGRCGMIPDGCGGVVDCGGCMAGQNCGAMTPNVCGVGTCTPQSCADQGADCGTVSDGCGATDDCGTCRPPLTCGGGPDGERVPNRCGCTPQTCGAIGIECGMVTEACGTTVDCGACVMPRVCDATQHCCRRRNCGEPGLECGTGPDGCGGTRTCPGCMVPGQTCSMNTCVCTPDPFEPNDTPATARDVGLLSSGRVVLSTPNLHTAMDIDWYRMTTSGAILSDALLNVSIRGAPPGSTWGVGAYLDCDGPSTAGFVSAMCTSSTYVPMPFDGGCVVPSFTDGTTFVVQPQCSFSALYVAVYATTWTLSCGPYNLEVWL